MESSLLKVLIQKRDEKGQSGKHSFVKQTLPDNLSLNSSQDSNSKDLFKRIQSPNERKHSRISIRLQDKLNNQKDSKISDDLKIKIQMS
jgi:hypothetical protein